MQRHEVTNGWYGEALPTGEFAALRLDSHVETHFGVIPPPSPGNGPLFLRITAVPQFKFAGQGHGDGIAWEWTRSAGWTNVGTTFDVNPLVYNQQGDLILKVGPVSSQGYRYVDDANQPVTGNASHRDLPLDVFEFTKRGPFTVGFIDNFVGIVKDGVKRVIDIGHGYGANTVRYNRSADGRNAVSYQDTTELKTKFVWFTDAEFDQFPLPQPQHGDAPPPHVDVPHTDVHTDVPHNDTPPMDTGIENGIVVRPQAWFTHLRQGYRPDEYQRFFREKRQEIWAAGIGFQTDSGGTPRGRLYLPTAGCRNSAPAPGSPDEFLGVRQIFACHEGGRMVDVVNPNATEWIWHERGEPYVPFEPVVHQDVPSHTDVPPHADAPDTGLLARVATLEAKLAAVQTALDRKIDSTALGSLLDAKVDRNTVIELTGETSTPVPLFRNPLRGTAKVSGVVK